MNKVVFRQRFLLGARPTLDLRLAAAGGGRGKGGSGSYQRCLLAKACPDPVFR